MVVQTEQAKRDEQCPLLTMDAVGSIPSSPPADISPGWKVACVPKRSWLRRWSEYISACWVTLILLGITLLIFYALGISAYKRKSLVLVKCNTSKPESNVYFHHIIPRGGSLQFTLYSDYISSVAVEYPLLNIHVLFLVDDSLQTSMYGPRHSPIFNRFGSSIINNAFPVPMSGKDQRDLNFFEKRYRNVNITIMPLSQYMAMTPLRYKWKTIPMSYLPFYTRVFAVWEYSGIGLDLTTFNNQFNVNQMLDRRISAILKQHNDGIEEKRYIQALNNINQEEDTEYFNMFYNLMKSILNDTFSIFDNSLFRVPATTEKNDFATISRNYRNENENSIIKTNNTKKLKGNSSALKNYVLNNAFLHQIKESDFYSLILNSTANTGKSEKGKDLSMLNIKDNAILPNNNIKIVNRKGASELENSTNLLNLNSTFNTTKGGVNSSLTPFKIKENSTSFNEDKLKKVNNSKENNLEKVSKMYFNDVWKKSNFYNGIRLENKDNLIHVEPKTNKNLDNAIDNKQPNIKTGTQIPHMVLFYDFSVFSDALGPSYYLPDIHQTPNIFENNILRKQIKREKNVPYLLSLISDGSFVAASTRHHPFLGHLLTSGCKRVNPRFAIEDTMFSQCSGFLRNDVYCENIYILD